jgi:hypothetical protein
MFRLGGLFVQTPKGANSTKQQRNLGGKTNIIRGKGKWVAISHLEPLPLQYFYIIQKIYQ